MTEESKLLLNKIELIAKNILDLSMPESKLEDMSADILDLCDKIKHDTAANNTNSAL